MSELRIKTPRWFVPLIAPARYKGAHGGRGSGKSHAFAEYVIERAATEKTDIVCIREFQRSLGQSVKKLIEIKIEAMGLGHMFDVQQAVIYSNRPVSSITSSSMNEDWICWAVFADRLMHTQHSIETPLNLDGAGFREAARILDLGVEAVRGQERFIEP